VGTLTVAAGGYNVAFLGTQTTVTAAAVFSNTGSVTLGDQFSDSTRFSGGVSGGGRWHSDRRQRVDHGDGDGAGRPSR
jgi:hypothetical protein